MGYASQAQQDPQLPLLVTASAPLLTGKRAVVYVQKQEDDEGTITYEGREVVLGPRAGDSYVVLAGLEEGDVVVTHGAFKIDSELQIQARPSMMAPPEEVGSSLNVEHNNAPTLGARRSSQHSESNTPDKPVGTVAIRSAIGPIYSAYFDVHKALTNDDNDAAHAAAANLRERVSAVDMSVFEGDVHMRWMALAKKLQNAAAAVSGPDDIEATRSAFADLSSVVVDLEKTFGHSGDDTFYMVFCPMARDGEGASWIQTSDDTNNPYFGQSMLYCGSIKRTYKPTR